MNLLRLSCSSLRRGLSVFAVFLFVLGCLVLPAGHVATAGHHDCASEHGADGDPKAPEPHKADQCAVCQLAHAPVALTTPVAAPSVVAVRDELSASPVATPVHRVAHILPFSCGPPA